MGQFSPLVTIQLQETKGRMEGRIEGEGERRELKTKGREDQGKGGWKEG